MQEYTGQWKSQPEIARLFGSARGTVMRYQRAQTVPGSAPRERPREIDRYMPYLREHWEAGEHTVRMLWEAIRTQGFGGSYHYLGVTSPNGAPGLVAQGVHPPIRCSLPRQYLRGSEPYLLADSAGGVAQRR